MSGKSLARNAEKPGHQQWKKPYEFAIQILRLGNFFRRMQAAPFSRLSRGGGRGKPDVPMRTGRGQPFRVMFDQ